MADRYQLLLGENAEPADEELYAALSSVHVEEHAELPGAIRLEFKLSVEGQSGEIDLSVISNPALQPYERIAVVIEPREGPRECVFDGYVLSHELQLDRSTIGSSALILGEDASCLMNIKQRVRSFEGTDGQTANQIFEHDYGFEPANGNLEDDSPEHRDDNGQVLMQRATDRQFLSELARRTGKLFRVACGSEPGRNYGYFSKPNIDAGPATTIILNHPEPVKPNVDRLKISWNVARPASVQAHVLLTAKDPTDGGTDESGISLLEARSLADFVGDSEYAMEARLTTAADSAQALHQRAAALLRDAGWFVQCDGETDLARMSGVASKGESAVLRVGQVVHVNGAGGLHSGKYLVWKVHHTITSDTHRMAFSLVRNAIGAA